MLELNLTVEAFNRLKESNCVYCIRGELLYLVERKDGKLKTTIFNAPVRVYAYTNDSQQTAIRV